MAKKSQYEHKLEYNNMYNRTNYRSFSVRFNNKSEADMIKWLEKKDSIKAYVTELITADMKKAKNSKAKKTVAAPAKKATTKAAAKPAKKAPAKKTAAKKPAKKK